MKGFEGRISKLESRVSSAKVSYIAKRTHEGNLIPMNAGTVLGPFVAVMPEVMGLDEWVHTFCPE
jgi:hypothetical protein